MRTAVTLADRNGLDGATLPKVAKALDVTPMSLYRHIGSKDELLVLMHDAALGRPPATIGSAADWREGLRRWANAARTVNQARPWLTRIPITGPPSGPNEIAWLEAGLHALRGTRLDWPQKIGSLTLLNGYVRHSTLLSQDLTQGRGDTTQTEAERRYAGQLTELVSPDDYPEMAQLLASGMFQYSEEPPGDDPVLDQHFAFGLEVILDGIATR